jgi:hypothetical protein
MLAIELMMDSVELSPLEEKSAFIFEEKIMAGIY